MKRTEDRGAVLVVVLLVIMVLLGLGMGGLYLTSGSVQMATNINLSNQARLVAEAGLERAREILGNPANTQDLHAMLTGNGHFADDVPTDTSKCETSRGAVLRADSPLVNVPYPTTINRTADLPTGAGQNVTPLLGTYTLYVRQDLSDCRMGNFTCEMAPVSTFTCTPGESAPEPNGTIIIRSEGVAVDGRTMVVVEAGYSFRAAAPSGTGGSGTGGSGTGGTGGSDTGGSGTGGSGTGGSGTGSSGTGGSTTPPPGTGGSGTGGSGSPGTGGSGTGGSTNSFPCLRYAVSAVAPCSNGWIPGCLTINRDSTVDGFNRSAGPYSSATNHTPTSVAMSCSAASNTCPNNCPSGCITGGVNYGVAQSLSTSTLPVPSYTSDWSQITVPPTTTLYPANPPAAAYYHEVDLNGGTLTLRAGDYVVEYLNLNAAGTLYVDDTDGPVHLWVTTQVSPNSTVIVKSGNPKNFWLIYNGTGAVNNNTGNNFTGVLFAPAADVNLNYHVTGAVVGGHVTLNGPAQVRFDTGLSCP